ncbi:MAG TPA: SusC/RagA family TonB-linked outer membrane protein [Chryseosolibacter sp.]
MQRILILAGLIAFLLPSAFAQETIFSGTVRDGADNTVIPGVSVSVKGTKSGVITDTEGKFSVSASPGSTLVFSFIGYTTQEIKLGAGTSLNVTMQADITTLSEVVVTAMGIKQEKRALGYAAQELKGSEIAAAGQANLVSGLQGKVAGVRIQNSGGAPGSGVSVLIRGVNSISPNRSSEPLFVIDGVPISNETTSGSLLPSSGSNSPGTNEQYAFSNRAIDLNPDDIESVTVLKGPAATALYGLRASNGVILITTKKGQVGGMQVAYNGSVGWDKVNVTPEIQRKYREGTTGVRRFGVAGAGTPFQTFGPPVAEGEPVYDNMRNFFRTGMRVNNSVSVSGGDQKSNYYTSVSNLHQRGIVPNSMWDRTTIKLSGNSNLSERLSVRGSATYSNSGGLRAQGGDKSIMSALTYHTTSVDVNDYINPNGTIKSYAGTIIDNPRYVAEFSTLEDNVDRIIGYSGLNYKITEWLVADYQVGVDFFGDSRTRIAPNGLDISTSSGGFMVEEKNTYREINSNFLLTATRSFSEDLKGTFMIGNNVLDIKSDLINSRGEKFGIKGFYDLSNTATKFSFKDGYIRRLIGVFGDFKLDYKGTLYLNVTARNDWSSTLPTANRSFFYPSVNVGYVFTETLANSGPLSYGKVRGSFAQVGKDASAYSFGQYYESAVGFPFNAISGFRKSTTVGSDNLTSEKTSSIEFGTELKFLQNRISLDATYYNALSINQIVEVPVANSSGLSRYVTNAGEIRNTGIELLLSGTPISSNNVTWEVALNWSKNRSKVLSMPEGISEIFFQDDRIANKLVVGGSVGDLYGRPYKRNENGSLLIDASGFPTWSDSFVKVGNALPDWMGGLTNTITVKNLSFSFLMEVRKGGDVYDTGLRNRVRNGIDIRTELRNVDVIFDGVTATGEPNTMAVRLDGDTFYRNESRYNGVAEVLLQDASWVRLRSANLSYSIPKSMLERTPVKSLTISAAGTNLFLSTPFQGFDPEGNAYGSGTNQFGYTGLNIPATKNFTLSLNATF